MPTSVQILLFVLLSPLWILGLLLVVAGWRRRLLGKQGSSSARDGLSIPTGEGSAQRSVVLGWIMMPASIVPLGITLMLVPRPSIVVFSVAAVMGLRAVRRSMADSPPVTPSSDEPLTPVLSGGWHAAAYALPMFILVIVMSAQSNVQASFWFHLGIAALLGLLSNNYESLRPHRDGVIVVGEIVGSERHVSTGGDSGPPSIYYTPFVRFRSGADTIIFNGLPSKIEPTLGSMVTVSHHPSEPDRARAVPDDWGKPTLRVLAGMLVVGSFLLGWTSLPLIALGGLGHWHYVVRDRRAQRSPVPSAWV